MMDDRSELLTIGIDFSNGTDVAVLSVFKDGEYLRKVKVFVGEEAEEFYNRLTK